MCAPGGGGGGGREADGSCLRLDLACIIMGITGFVASAALAVASAVLLATGAGAGGGAPPAPWGLSPRPLQIVLWTALVLALTSMLSSAMLVLGIKLRRSGLVVAHVAAGAVVSLCGALAALLLLLHARWVPALVLLFACLAPARSAVSAHALYEALLNGRQFAFSPHEALRDADPDAAADA